MSGFLYCLGLITFTALNYKTLANEEGWGIVFVFGLISLIIPVLFIDLLLQILVKNKIILNLFGVIVLFLVIVWFSQNIGFDLLN